MRIGEFADSSLGIDCRDYGRIIARPRRQGGCYAPVPPRSRRYALCSAPPTQTTHVARPMAETKSQGKLVATCPGRARSRDVGRRRDSDITVCQTPNRQKTRRARKTRKSAVHVSHYVTHSCLSSFLAVRATNTRDPGRPTGGRLWLPIRSQNHVTMMRGGISVHDCARQTRDVTPQSVDAGST